MIFTVLSILGLDAFVKKLNTRSGKYDVNEYGVYRDGNGSYRLQSNGHWVVDTYNYFGEHIIKNVKTGETEINIDDIESNKRKAEALKNNQKYYLFRPEHNMYHHIGNNEIKGHRYAKINGPGLYVIRTINFRPSKSETNPIVKYYCGEFYMDMAYNICEETESSRQRNIAIYGNQYNDITHFIINKANEHIGYFNNKRMFFGANKPINLSGALDDSSRLASDSLKRRRIITCTKK